MFLMLCIYIIEILPYFLALKKFYIISGHFYTYYTILEGGWSSNDPFRTVKIA